MPGPSAVRVRVTTAAVVVDLSDGRTVSAPLAWYPRLLHGTARERRRWRLIGGGEGVRWPDLDEDLEVDGLLAGRRSAESSLSFRRWLRARQAAGRKQARPARVTTRVHGRRRAPG